MTTVSRPAAAPAAAGLGRLYAEHSSLIWGLCYRMTGSAADADDLLQETFVRALERPPEDRSRSLKPWLVRVGVNLAKDHLRARRRRRYVGPWLPSPIETDGADAIPALEALLADGQTTEGRYDLLESVSYAFLVALEALTPQQRAVLLLRDVFDYSGAETAEALAISVANVKTTLHRARRAMSDYDANPARLGARATEHARVCLAKLTEALMAADVPAIESLLLDDVVATSDGGKHFRAARRPVFGPNRVARLYVGIWGKRSGRGRFEVRMLNGLPALVAEFEDGRDGNARRFVQLVEPAADGRVRRLHTVLAADKLTAIRPFDF